MKTVNRFIVVDDDPINNIICNSVIHQAVGDMEVKLFEQPEAALEAIEDEYSKSAENVSTILLLDINMPVMTGWDFLDVFKNFTDKIHKQFTIYIVSSSIDARDRQRAELNGFVAKFISKPLTADLIKEIYLG